MANAGQDRTDSRTSSAPKGPVPGPGAVAPADPAQVCVADLPRYTERLWPGPWLWLLCLGAAGALAVAYGSALGAAAGWLVGIGGVVTVVTTITSTTPRVAVTADGLQAGRAVLPLQFAGRVLVLDATSTRMARGPAGDPTAFVLLRPGVGPGSVVVEVTDAEDPHRTWLLASRHPQRLGSAICAARGTLSP